MTRLGQRGNGVRDGEDVALEIRIEHQVERLLGHLLEAALGEDARVRAQHVETAMQSNRLVDDALAVLGPAHVTPHERGVRTERGNGGGARRGVPAGDRDLAAGIGEDARDAEADALGAAGDEDAAALKRVEHLAHGS
jgi:hypothetical protein